MAELARMVRGEVISPYGALHIVVDDWNLEDGDFSFCLALDYCTDADREWSARMMKLPEDDRFAVMGLAEGYWHG